VSERDERQGTAAAAAIVSDVIQFFKKNFDVFYVNKRHKHFVSVLLLFVCISNEEEGNSNSRLLHLINFPSIKNGESPSLLKAAAAAVVSTSWVEAYYA